MSEKTAETHSFGLSVVSNDLQVMVDSIPALAWSALPDGTLDFFNQHYLDYVGQDLASMQDRQWTKVVHPDDLGVLDSVWSRCTATHRNDEVEARLLRHDGQYRWFVFRAKAVLDAEGATLRWYGINFDIDEQKRASELLVGERRILEMIAGGQPLKLVLEDLCRMVEDAAPECFCDIHAADATRCTIEYSIAPSLPPSYKNPIAGTELDGTKLPCGIAVKEKIQVIAEDIETDPRWRHSPVRIHVLNHGFKAVWSTPIYSMQIPRQSAP